MANFDVKDAEFSEQLRKFEVTDPVHADLINRVIEQLIKNDVALKNAEDMSDKTVLFEEAKDRKNIESREPLKVLFGKIKKWFSSLGAASFYNVVNSDAVTEQGFLPDARLLKVHKDTLNALQQQITSLESSVTALNRNLLTINKKIVELESKQMQVSGGLSDWLILKYPNGYIEAHRRYQYTGIATTTSAGGQYVSGTLWSGSTPVIAGVTWNGGHGMASYGSRSAGTYFYRLDQINDGAGAVRCIIACRISATNVNFPAHIVLTGTWR